MGNMSYCRFHNTEIDLDDCVSAIEHGEIDELSENEIKALERIQILAKCIIELEEEIITGIMRSKEYGR
tara:strand:- start:457 stop:663 length:207 start_codon:yes stop_codon:yes gene_type:complete